MGSPKPHVAIFPCAGMGHLIPLAELAMRLSDRHRLSITFITCKWMFSSRLMDAYTERIASSGLEITFVQLPEVEIEGAEHMKIEPIGSGTALPREQVTELVVGLEASGHRFLWVLRSPSNSFLSVEETEISELLPEGFESRTQDRGLVVPSWAPQFHVLSHPSTGGFISHSGWNSTLETISHGVPIICWPLFAEQKFNRFLLVNEFKVTIETKMEGDGFVRREEVERAVKELMEGEGGTRVRERAGEWKEKAMSALEEGGSSYKAIAAVVSEWTTNAKHSAAAHEAKHID